MVDTDIHKKESYLNGKLVLQIRISMELFLEYTCLSHSLKPSTPKYPATELINLYFVILSSYTVDFAVQSNNSIDTN